MEKSEIIKAYQTHDGDTGSPEVQIALLTERINHLTDHLKVHQKDDHRLHPTHLVLLCCNTRGDNGSALPQAL